jgi:crotonobetainyl-CoA:carnitine CoA-transferase CaiB-like acyl-CoA transferase
MLCHLHGLPSRLAVEESRMAGPMSGVKVVEMGVWVAGPASGCVLADWGAEVLKIEPVAIGDPSRLFSRMLGADLPFNPPFEMDNRGKRSIAIDLGHPEGLAIALELIDAADVFLTNVRMAGLERLGLDYASLKRRNPRLVYAAISGYGFEGPDAERAGYDIAAFWARSGIAHSLTNPGADPPFQRGGMGDHSVALTCAGAVSAALYAREKTGEGRLVTTSLLRQGIYTLSFDFAFMLRFGATMAIADRSEMKNPCINSYRDRDGRWFWIVGLEGERHWPPLCRALEHPEWQQDPRFLDAAQRAANAAELIELIDAIFATRPLAEWGPIFDAEEDFFWAPVQSLEEALADPQTTASGGLVEVMDGESTLMFPATPADFGGESPAPRPAAPSHGEHTDAVLAALGRSAGVIDRLRADGVVL